MGWWKKQPCSSDFICIFSVGVSSPLNLVVVTHLLKQTSPSICNSGYWGYAGHFATGFKWWSFKLI